MINFRSKKGEVTVRDILGILIVIGLIINGFYFTVSTIGHPNLGYNVSVYNPYEERTDEILGYDNTSMRANITTLKESVQDDGASQADPDAFSAPIKIIFNIGGFVFGSFGMVSKMISTIAVATGLPGWVVSGLTTFALMTIVFIIISAYNKYRT